MRVFRGVLLCCFSVVLLSTIAHALPSLEEELATLNGMRIAPKTDLNQVDRIASDLLRRYDAPEDLRKIYFTLVMIDAHSGVLRPDKLIDYIERALALPIESEKRIRLRMYLSNAIEIKNRRIGRAEFVAARKEAAKHNMIGIRESLLEQAKTAEEMTKPAAPVIVDPRRPGPDNRALGAESLRQANLKHRMGEFSDWQMHHEDQIVCLYSEFPFAKEEVRLIATEIVGDPDVVRRLVERVTQSIEERAKSECDKAVAPAGNGI
jgi:hypothetical protein